jgi:hypothetical protein
MQKHLEDTKIDLKQDEMQVKTRRNRENIVFSDDVFEDSDMSPKAFVQ